MDKEIRLALLARRRLHINRPGVCARIKGRVTHSAKARARRAQRDADSQP